MPGPSRPRLAKMSSARPWARYWRGTPSTRVAGTGRPADSTCGRHGVEQEGAGAPVAHAVLDRDHEAVAGRVGQHRDVGRRDHPHVPDGGVDPLGGQLVGGGQAGLRPSCPRRAGRPTRRRRAAGAPEPAAHLVGVHVAGRASWARGWWTGPAARGRRAASARPPRPPTARTPSCRGWRAPGPGRGSRGGWGRRRR